MFRSYYRFVMVRLACVDTSTPDMTTLCVRACPSYHKPSNALILISKLDHKCLLELLIVTDCHKLTVDNLVQNLFVENDGSMVLHATVPTD